MPFDATDWGTVLGEYDFSDEAKITSSGSPALVSAVAPKSGTWGSIGQSTDAQKPTTGTRTSPTGLNMLDFGGNDCLLLDVADEAQPITLVAVAQADTNDNGNHHVLSNGSGGLQPTLHINESAWQYYAGVARNSTHALTTGELHVIVGLFNGASSRLWVDGEEHSPGDPGSNSLTQVLLGGFAAGDLYMWDGPIAHVIYYDGLVADPGGLSDALNLKWITGEAGTITLDAVAEAAAPVAGNGPVTWSHVLGSGSDRKVIIGCGQESTGAGSVPTVTFDGVACTLAKDSGDSGGSSQARAQLFYIDEADLPGSGTYTVSVTYTSTGAARCWGRSVSVIGCNSGAPDDTASWVGNSVTSHQTSITAHGSNGWVFDFFTNCYGASDANITPDADQVNVAKDGSTTLSAFASSTKPEGAATTTLGWTFDSQNGQGMAHALAEWTPSGAGPEPITLTAGTALVTLGARPLSLAGAGSVTLTVGVAQVTASPRTLSIAGGPIPPTPAPPRRGYVLSGEALPDMLFASRESTIRFDLLDQTLTKIGEVHPDMDSPATVTNNINRSIKRDLEGMVLPPDEEAYVDPLVDRVRPVWVFSDGAEYTCGAFLWADASRKRRSYGLTLSSSLVDQGLILDQPISETIGLQTGVDVTAVIVDLAVQAGFSAIDVEAGGYTVGSPVAWKVGTPLRQVMDDLCAAIGFFSVYFDRDGVLVGRKATDYQHVDPDLIYEAGGRIIDDSIVESDDLLSAPNRYVVIGTAAYDAPVSAYYDIPDEAPHSFHNRGFRVVKVLESQAVATAAQAYDAALSLYAGDVAAYKWVEFSSTPDPRHDTFDVVQFLGANYREQEWSLPLREGEVMTHSLRRLY